MTIWKRCGGVTELKEQGESVGRGKVGGLEETGKSQDIISSNRFFLIHVYDVTDGIHVEERVKKKIKRNGFRVA